jgi:AcrR family transcriptional regulator
MSPRPYQLGKRQEQVDEVRQRVIGSARSLLAGSTSYTDFTIDAVAKKADVARATVYYQFESKTGLLEAICDSMAVDGRLFELEAAFRQPDPHQGLREFVEGFTRFWAVDRLAMRRLRALSALDPEVGSVIRQRDQRRRRGLEVLIGRIFSSGGGPPPPDVEDLLTVAHTLTSFETFDSLATRHHEPAEVADEVTELIEMVVQRYQRPGGRSRGPAGGSPGGSTGGSTEGSTGGSTEGSTEGSTGGSTAGSAPRAGHGSGGR